MFLFMLQVPVINFSVMPGRFPVFLGCTSTKQRIKCLAQGHNTVPPISLELIVCAGAILKGLTSLLWHITAEIGFCVNMRYALLKTQTLYIKK